MGLNDVKKEVVTAIDHYISSVQKKDRLDEQIAQIDKKILTLQEQRKKLAEKRDRVGSYTEKWGRGKKAQKVLENEEVRKKISLRPKNFQNSNENTLGRN